MSILVSRMECIKMSGENSSNPHNIVENKNLRILIAEDDLTARTILTGVIKKWGYEPVVVNDGLAAWEVMQKSDSPRLAILDWVMPGLEGPEVIQRLRAIKEDQPAYIILLTSKDEIESLLSGLESGANDYIKKPFSNEELLARIRVGQRSIELQSNLYETQKKLEHLATHDPLLGILNRRAILEQLKKELARFTREKNLKKCQGLRIGYFDIDNFKGINDHYGHKTGDDVLLHVVNIVNSQLREYDTFGRLGGDEFLIIAPDINGEKQNTLFDRITNSIADCKIKTEKGEVSITVSMGVSTAQNDRTEDQLLSKADEAMYLAKREGGNRIINIDK